MQLDAEQIVMALLQHDNEIVRLATENAVLQAQVQALMLGGAADVDDGLGDPVEGGAETEPEGEGA